MEILGGSLMEAQRGFPTTDVDSEMGVFQVVFLKKLIKGRGEEGGGGKTLEIELLGRMAQSLQMLIQKKDMTLFGLEGLEDPFTVQKGGVKDRNLGGL